MQLHWKNYLWAGFLLTTSLFLGGADGSGCGGKSAFENLADDGTKEARVEKARIALDEGNYSLAITTMESLCGIDLDGPSCEPELVSLYASGYAGRAGLDIFDLIEGAATQTVAPGGSFTLFSRHFTNPTNANEQDMRAAVRLLDSIPARTADQGFQLAITATSDLVVSLGRLTNGFDPETGKPNAVPQLPADLPKVLAVLPVVQDDLALMETGLTESGLRTQNVAGHIDQIRLQLSGDATALVNFLALL